MDPDAGSPLDDDADRSRLFSQVRGRRLSVAQAIGTRLQRRLWDRRADSWEGEGSAGLVAVVDAVLSACEPTAGVVAVDLGCGSGQVTIPLARRCARVLGVDVSPRSIDRLRARCAAAGITNVETRAVAIETLDLAPASVGLIVSNYALHHLGDDAKAELLRCAARWLVPGGRLVVGDMMFGRGAAAADRRIIAGKLRGLVLRGPGGWWRIAKNVWRFGLRQREKPLPRARWEALARDAGLTAVRTVPIVAEASMLLARRPPADGQRDPAGEVEIRRCGPSTGPRPRAVVRVDVPGAG